MEHSPQATTVNEAERCENRVREFREDRLMTLEELAHRSGLSVRTVWSVENGYPCRLATKRRILRGLGVARRDHGVVFPVASREGVLGTRGDPRPREGVAPAAE